MKLLSSDGRRGDAATCGEEGQTTVIMVLFLATFLLGFVALGIDVESLFQAKRQAQAAADAAAVAAAEESSSGASSENAAAYAIAKLNGFDTLLAINPAVVQVGIPSSGNYSGSPSYVQVRVSKPVPTFFAHFITNKSTVTVGASAVAGSGLSSPTCVCLQGTSGTDLFLSNNSKFSPMGCGTTVNSSTSTGGYPSPLSSGPAVYMTGGSTLSGLAIGSVATNWDTSSNVSNGASVATSTKVVQGLTTTCAPLPTKPSYSAASCTADPLTHYGNGGSKYSVGPGSTYSTTQTGGVVCYNSLTIGSNGDTVNLNPGIYVINGGSLHFLSAKATGGSGVFFYLVGNASLTIDNGANVTLSAATSGTYSGDLIYQDSADTKAISIQGGANTNLSGAIYAPSSNVTLGNGSGTAITDDLVAKTLTMNGGGTFSSSASANFGNLNISTAKLGE